MIIAVFFSIVVRCVVFFPYLFHHTQTHNGKPFINTENSAKHRFRMHWYFSDRLMSLNKWNEHMTVDSIRSLFSVFFKYVVIIETDPFLHATNTSSAWTVDSCRIVCLRSTVTGDGGYRVRVILWFFRSSAHILSFAVVAAFPGRLFYFHYNCAQFNSIVIMCI